MRAVLRCPVRACPETLAAAPDGRSFACARRHSFDRNRFGALNLLQPQDRRSRKPGDSVEAARARKRLAAAGGNEALLLGLIDVIVKQLGPEIPTLLDVGCGEGALLRALSAISRGERYGLDLSSAAIDLAARAAPNDFFVVANADRFLPFVDASFDALMSVDARLNAAEFHRVLKPRGLLVVAVPAADDLIELRARVLGEGRSLPRGPRVESDLEAHFHLIERLCISDRRVFPVEVLRDFLTATYRGFRAREREQVAALTEMQLTLSHDILLFAPRATGR